AYSQPTWAQPPPGQTRPRPAPRPQPSPPPAHACPRPPSLDAVQGTLAGVYGGATYGGGNGRSRFVVTVSDYLTLAPIAGVPVVIDHNSGPCNRNSGCRPMHPHPPLLLSMRA